MPLTATSTPAAPAFDWSKSSHEVEQLICKDDALGQLDVKLAKAYADAEMPTASPRFRRDMDS